MGKIKGIKNESICMYDYEYEEWLEGLPKSKVVLCQCIVCKKMEAKDSMNSKKMCSKCRKLLDL